MKTSEDIATEIIQDMRDGKSDEFLMKKHGVSADCLLKLKRALLEKGLLKQPESRESKNRPSGKKKTIDAKEFVASFRVAPDDSHLMQEYGLKPMQLKKVYNALISRGLLSEYEFHCRKPKAPELEEPTVNLTDSSTQVSMVESFSEETLRLFRSGRSGQQCQSSVNHGPSLVSEPLGNSEVRSCADNDAQERCPHCGRSKASSSHDVCAYCGIVFSKMRHSMKYRGVAIWDMDAP
jgi:hypothetical protein